VALAAVVARIRAMLKSLRFSRTPGALGSSNEERCR
jgi:hypothetical protein